MIGFLYRLIVGRFTSCQHHWTTTNEQQGILTCSVCGDIKQYPLECCHHWEEYSKNEVTQQGITCGVMHIMKCTHCGDLTDRTFTP